MRHLKNQDELINEVRSPFIKGNGSFTPRGTLGMRLTWYRVHMEALVKEMSDRKARISDDEVKKIDAIFKEAFDKLKDVLIPTGEWNKVRDGADVILRKDRDRPWGAQPN